MSLKSKIQSLLAAANETTGESDTNLTDAMQNLIDGYGGGVTKYAVTYSLATHLASSNTASKVADGNSYTTTIISTELDAVKLGDTFLKHHRTIVVQMQQILSEGWQQQH